VRGGVSVGHPITYRTVRSSVSRSRPSASDTSLCLTHRHLLCTGNHSDVDVVHCHLLFLPRDAMHKRGLGRRAVTGWLAVTLLYFVETVKIRPFRYRMRIGNRTQAFHWYYFQ